jgi:integrase
VRGREVKVSGPFKRDGHTGRVRKRHQFPTRAAAQDARDAFIEKRKRPKPRLETKTFKDVADRYEQHKAAKKSIREDRRILKNLTSWFGPDRQINTVTADLIDQHDVMRASKVSERTGARVGAASRNRDLAVLRSMLRLAQRWGYVEKVPEIHLQKEPEGRARYLEPDEEARLLEACQNSKNPHLAKIVTVAMETGMR